MANINQVQDPPTDKHSDDTPRKSYGAYQNEVYRAGMVNNVKPTVTKDPSKLEAQAREALPARSYSYVAGGAGERATMEANRLAFRMWKVSLITCPLSRVGNLQEENRGGIS